MEPDRDGFLLKMIANYCDNIVDAINEFNLDEQTIVNNNGYRAMLAFFVQQIGETANKLSDNFKNEHPEIEWKAIIGFRNRIVHDYGRILPDILWDTMENDIPELRNFCIKFL